MKFLCEQFGFVVTMKSQSSAGSRIRKFVESKKQWSATHRVDGVERRIGSGCSGTGDVTEQLVPSDLRTIMFSTGRTVNVGPYRFARVECSCRLSSKDDVCDDAYEVCRVVASEIVSRECAALTKSSRDMELVCIDGVGDKWFDVEVSLSYGITVPAEGYQSSKVDVSRSSRVVNGNDAEVVVSELQDWMAKRISVFRDMFERGDFDLDSVEAI